MAEDQQQQQQQQHHHPNLEASPFAILILSKRSM